jgi:hypothetical protein
VTLLGSTVMLSVSAAKGPYRHAGENAFDGPPPGHPDKALISTAWIDDRNAESFVTDSPAFDWGLQNVQGCPQCGFKDAQVMPVVLDMPELLGGSDETAVDVIKRKLGINPFRGSIFEGPETPAAQLQKQDAPAELKAFDCVLEKLTAIDTSAECGSQCLQSQTAACTTGSGECAAACTGRAQTAQSAEGDSAPEFLINAADLANRNYSVGLSEPADGVELLRQVSPGLDELANKLEDADLFAEADAIREAAQRLRIKARELKSRATPVAMPVPWRPVSTTTASDCCKDQCSGQCPCTKSRSAAGQRTGGVQVLQ